MSGDDPGGGRDALVLLHIFPGFSYGGQQARLAALVRGLGEGFRHHVVSLDGEISAAAMFDDEAPVDFSSYPLKKSSGLSLSNILGLRKLIRNIAPDLLCTYNWGSIEAVAANRLGMGKPHIHFEDGFGPGETIDTQSRRRVIARRLLLRRSVVVVPSAGLESAARFLWKLPVHYIRRIVNGVDVERFQGTMRGHPSAVTVGSVGSLRPEKNYGRLISGFRYADRDRRARLEIVGGGPERDALVRSASGDDRIVFPGSTSAPGEAYARFDIFALSSDTEQAPISLMEAMASGLPVVATNVGEIAEMVAEENLPYIVKPGDDEAYAHALAQMLQNSGARAEIGAANRRKAREAFGIENMIDAHRRLYLSVARGDE